MVPEEKRQMADCLERQVPHLLLLHPASCVPHPGPLVSATVSGWEQVSDTDGLEDLTKS